MTLLIIVLIIVALISAFALQNAAQVTVSFLFWKFQASLAIVTFLSVLVGAIAASIIAFWLNLKKKKKIDASN